MSLGGYIAGPSETGFGQLFQWYGDVEVPSACPRVLTIRTSAQSAALLKAEWGSIGALVKDVVVNGGQIARQCLEESLLDEVAVELGPVVLGGGKTLFGEVAPTRFEGPASVVEGAGVAHRRYRVVRQA